MMGLVEWKVGMSQEVSKREGMLDALEDKILNKMEEKRKETKKYQVLKVKSE